MLRVDPVSSLLNDSNGRERERYKLPYGALITVGKKSDVEAGTDRGYLGPAYSPNSIGSSR